MNFSLDAYQAWRQRQGSDYLRVEDAVGKPRERLLQYIWQHQRLVRQGLKTIDGQSCEVLHPGFWNHGPGPDFSQALIRVNGGELREGDVEIDCEVQGWKLHGHDRNPAFKSVVLQVVWSTAKERVDGRAILAIEPHLDASVDELSQLFENLSPDLPVAFRGRCCSPLHDLPLATTRSVLRSAALYRFRQKAYALGSRARTVGWDQALWEGLIAGLGYSRNGWPMRRLGELTPSLFPGFPRHWASQWTRLEIEARLFGVAGFMPDEPPRDELQYFRQLWDVWWRVRDQFRDSLFPKRIWRMTGVRPHNHPHRRLALAAQWLANPDFVRSLEWWFMSATEENLVELLRNALAVPASDYWSRHLNFNRSSVAVSPYLIGEGRMIDLAVNCILPWFWGRAKVGNNSNLQERAEFLYYRLPRSDENRKLKDGRLRLMGRCDPKMMASAADQQGLLQILRDFCSNSDALCQDCRFPDLVGSLGKSSS